jgi:hypothetical protein
VHQHFFHDPRSTPSGRKVRADKEEEEEREITVLIVATNVYPAARLQRRTGSACTLLGPIYGGLQIWLPEQNLVWFAHLTFRCSGITSD